MRSLLNCSCVNFYNLSLHAWYHNGFIITANFSAVAESLPLCF